MVRDEKIKTSMENSENNDNEKRKEKPKGHLKIEAGVYFTMKTIASVLVE